MVVGFFFFFEQSLHVKYSACLPYKESVIINSVIVANNQAEAY